MFISIEIQNMIFHTAYAYGAGLSVCYTSGYCEWGPFYSWLPADSIFRLHLSFCWTVKTHWLAVVMVSILVFVMIMVKGTLKHIEICALLREGFKNPNHGFLPWWWYPPPSRQAAGQKINGKKITAKGGTPSPPHHGKRLGFFLPKTAFFA